MTKITTAALKHLQETEIPEEAYEQYVKLSQEWLIEDRHRIYRAIKLYAKNIELAKKNLFVENVHTYHISEAEKGLAEFKRRIRKDYEGYIIWLDDKATVEDWQKNFYIGLADHFSIDDLIDSGLFDDEVQLEFLFKIKGSKK
jgi:glucan-binding YG repeat protein